MTSAILTSTILNHIGQRIEVNPYNLIIVGYDTPMAESEGHPLLTHDAGEPVNKGLAQQIETHGQLEPILVVPTGEKSDGADGADKGKPTFYVVDGRSRAKAIRWLFEKDASLKVRCEVTDADELSQTRAGIVANTGRKENTPRSKAEQLRKLQAQVNKDGKPLLSKKEMAVDLNCTTQALSQFEKFWLLSDKVQLAVDKGQVSFTAACELAHLSHDKQDAALEGMMKAGVKPTTAATKSNAATGGEGEDGTASAFKAPSKRTLKMIADCEFDGDVYSSQLFMVRETVLWILGRVDSGDIDGLNAWLLKLEESTGPEESEQAKALKEARAKLKETQAALAKAKADAGIKPRAKKTATPAVAQ